MNSSGWIQLILYVGILLAITKPLGLYLCQVLDVDGKTFLDPVFKPLERLTYKLIGVDPKKEHDWKQYTIAMLLFSLVSMLFTYAILRLQAVLPFRPLNPQKLGAVSEHLAFQYRGQLHHEHQLAELRRRKHDVLLLADGRAGHP